LVVRDQQTKSDVARVAARERIALVTGAALLMAGLILVGAVLPAEFGVDPLGVGRRLGLLAIGEVQKQLTAFEATRAASASGVATVTPQEHAYQHETVEFTIGPRDSIEYKYRLDKGEALLYSWKATGPLNEELHAEPDGAPAGYAESFEKKNGVATASGTLTSPFSGIHGWYWENIGDVEVTVTLSAAGFYNMSHEFRKNVPTKTRMFE
jgi:hypothetical protein